MISAEAPTLPSPTEENGSWRGAHARGGALYWAARGHKVLPVKALGKEPCPGVKWKEEASCEPEQIQRWSDRFTDCNWAVVCGDGLSAVDFDSQGAFDKLLNSLSPADRELMVDTHLVITPRGVHCYFAADLPQTVGRLAPGIDTRGNGKGYVLLPGSVRVGQNGEEQGYELLNDGPPGAPPAAVVNSLVNADRERNKPGVAADRTPLCEVDQPCDVGAYTDWLKTEAPIAVQGKAGRTVAFAVAVEGSARGLSEAIVLDLMAEHWNGRCRPPWSLDPMAAPEDSLAERVASAFRDGHPDHRPGYRSLSLVQKAFAGIDIEDEAFPRSGSPRPAGLPGQGRQWFMHGDAYRNAVDWLYRGLLPTVGVAMLSAASGDGKTFLALHLACSLATGRPFFGDAPRKRGATLLLVGEAFGSIMLRLGGLEHEDGKPLPIAATRVGGLAQRGEWEAICRDVEEQAALLELERGRRVRLVVLDTLSASGILSEENDNGQAAAVMKLFGELSAKMGALFLVIHHPPKSGLGERGAGALRNNADYVLTIERPEADGQVRQVVVTKSRDGECRVLGSFTLTPKSLGFDDDEEEIVTMTVSTGAPRGGAAGARPAKHAKLLSEAFDEVRGQGPTATLEKVRQVFKQRLADEHCITRSGSVTKAWRAALKTSGLESTEIEGRRFLTYNLKSFGPVSI